MPFLPPNCMAHDCLFIYIAAGHHIWRSFPYPPPGDAAGSLQQGPNILQKLPTKSLTTYKLVNRLILMHQHAGSPSHSTCCYTELTASFINFLHYCLHVLDFMVQGKTTEAAEPTICLDTTPSGLLVPPPPSSPIFYTKCPLWCNHPNLSWLGTGIE